MYGRVRLTASSVVHEVPPATKDVYQTCVSVQIAELRVRVCISLFKYHADSYQ